MRSEINKIIDDGNRQIVANLILELARKSQCYGISPTAPSKRIVDETLILSGLDHSSAAVVKAFCFSANSIRSEADPENIRCEDLDSDQQIALKISLNGDTATRIVNTLQNPQHAILQGIESGLDCSQLAEEAKKPAKKAVEKMFKPQPAVSIAVA